MANVIALPAAAAEPPPNTRRRGRLPKIVSSIAAQRQKRLFAMWDREKQMAEQVLEKLRRDQELAAHPAKDAIAPLEALLDLARSGVLNGLVYAAEIRNPAPLIGVCGAYKQDPLKAIGALTIIQHRLVSAMEDKPGA